MSFDLFDIEQGEKMLAASRRPSIAADPGLFDNFFPGAAQTAMEGFAKTARAIDLTGAVGPIVTDALTGGTDRQDAYFREHEAVFGSAVDYWTPKPGEVGTAGRVVGSLVPMLSTFAINTALAIGTGGLGTAEDLTREGVTSGKAVAAGMVDATGLALGAYLPAAFGTSVGTRLATGAAANVAQGVVTRAAQAKILEGDKAAERFNPWDSEAIVIDALMGAGFGAVHHLGAKAEDQARADAIEALRAKLTPTDKDAILVANQARHVEDTTAPGLPEGPVDRTAHVEAMQKAVADVLAGRPADVGRIIQDAHFADEPARIAAHEEVRQAVADEARATILEEVARSERVAAAEAVPGFLRSAEDLIALKGKDAPPRELAAEVKRAIEIAKKPGFQRTADEKRWLDAFMKGKGGDLLLGEVPEPKAPTMPKEAPPAPPEAVKPPNLAGREISVVIETDRGKATVRGDAAKLIDDATTRANALRALLECLA